MKSIRFYALASDWIPVFEYLESRNAVSYIPMNDIYEEQKRRYEFGRILPGLGCASAEQTIAGNSYLVAHMDCPLHISRMTQSDGQERFDVHQARNPESVRLIPGGRWNKSIIEGLIDTMSDTPRAQALMRGFTNPMRKHFRRIQARWVGPEAYQHWKKGLRLTGAEQSPPEYDLRETDT